MILVLSFAFTIGLLKFKDFLLSLSFQIEHPELLAIQDWDLQQYQLIVLRLRTLVLFQLHFNMCSLESSIIKNMDIQVTGKSTIHSLVSYLCQYWADYIVNTLPNEVLMKTVKFVIYKKLLFWLEAMSLLGRTYEATLILRRALTWKICL